MLCVVMQRNLTWFCSIYEIKNKSIESHLLPVGLGSLFTSLWTPSVSTSVRFDWFFKNILPTSNPNDIWQHDFIVFAGQPPCQRQKTILQILYIYMLYPVWFIVSDEPFYYLLVVLFFKKSKMSVSLDISVEIRISYSNFPVFLLVVLSKLL